MMYTKILRIGCVVWQNLKAPIKMFTLFLFTIKKYVQNNESRKCVILPSGAAINGVLRVYVLLVNQSLRSAICQKTIDLSTRETR